MHIAPNPDPVPRLWAAARAMQARMHASLGDAAKMARRVLIGADLAAARAWLRGLEALVRQIVLAQALALAQFPKPKVAPIFIPICALLKPKQSEPRLTKPRSHAFRLWPRPKPRPRIRQLNRTRKFVHEIYRDARQAERIAHMKQARLVRVPECVRIARRIEGVARVIARPSIAARRLAAKLRVDRPIAKTLIAQRMPRSPYLDRDVYCEASLLNFARGQDFFSAGTRPDSS